MRKLSLRPRMRTKFLRMLASDLLLRGSLTVTLTRAKELRRYAMRLSGLQSRGHQRYVVSQLYGPARARAGQLSGARILLRRTGFRLGDAAPCARVTLIND